MTMWVFGYGSLLWNPGFEVAEEVIGQLDGLCALVLHALYSPSGHG